MEELKNRTSEKQPVAFSYRNYLIMAAGYILVMIGFLLMTGPGTTDTHFEPDIFSIRRIGIAPVTSLAGFVVLLFGIVYRPVRGVLKKNDSSPYSPTMNR